VVDVDVAKLVPGELLAGGVRVAQTGEDELRGLGGGGGHGRSILSSLESFFGRWHVLAGTII
jgi:hypothetical protein